MQKIYLDVCCLNRPFDDQTQERIRLEAEAVLAILQRAASGRWRWVRSVVVDYEIDQTPNLDRRSRVKRLASDADEVLFLSVSINNRGEEIKQMGFKTYDALHIACAEAAAVDIFLSTDDRLLRVATRNADNLKVQIANPLTWLQEVLPDG